jgi:hypothetical protein
MSGDAKRLGIIETDLQKAPFVVYLEGKTDVDVFFALLGVPRPVSEIYQNVYVKGLKDGGSGGSEVKELLRAAQEKRYGGVLARGGVFGVIDGDGRDLQTLQSLFDAPWEGPLFSWKAYSVENLLAKAAWPAAWGSVPDWAAVLSGYAPYAALNRVHVHLMGALDTLRLNRFRNPEVNTPLMRDQDLKAGFSQDKHLLANRDVEGMFDTEAATVRGALAASLDQGHALVNGKWLVRHHALTLNPGLRGDQCLDVWRDAVRDAGGLREVRDLWLRITGHAP